MVEGAQRTFYAQKYADEWKSELVLLVDSEERASGLTEVIAEWQKLNRAVPLVVRALTLRQVAALLHGPDAAPGRV